MVASHFDQEEFVSCEDQLPRLNGIFNYACSVSGVIILLMQLRPVAILMRQHREILDMDAILYLASLHLLFYLNLHQHATGHIQVDLDAGGCLHSMFLALWLNNSLRSKAHVPCALARTFVIGAALVVLATCAFAPTQQSLVTNVLDGPAALYTIITMGKRSYRSRDKSSDGRFLYWCGAVVSLFLTQAVVLVEEAYVCDTVAARLFHATFIHAVIVCLFGNIFACAIRIIASERKMQDTPKDC